MSGGTPRRGGPPDTRSAYYLYIHIHTYIYVYPPLTNTYTLYGDLTVISPTIISEKTLDAQKENLPEEWNSTVCLECQGLFEIIVGWSDCQIPIWILITWFAQCRSSGTTTPNLLTNIVPTNIAWRKLSHRFPMDIEFHPLNLDCAGVKPPEIHNVSREIGRTYIRAPSLPSLWS